MPNNSETGVAIDSSAGGGGGGGAQASMVRAIFGDKRFNIVFVTMLIAACGLLLAVEKMKIHFRKNAVPIRIALKSGISPQLGDWVQVMREDELSEDLLVALDTNEYLFCTYINARALSKTPDQIRKEFSGKSTSECQKLVGQYRSSKPEAVLSTAFTYYTGKADTVAHIPDRCYLGEGFESRLNREEVWRIGNDNGSSPEKPLLEMPIRYITFESETTSGAMNLPYNVAYFFSVNGEYTCDSQRVRLRLQDLFNRYGYYSKMEMMCASPDREKAAAAMREFLLSALPSFEACLPDWSQYRNR